MPLQAFKHIMVFFAACRCLDTFVLPKYLRAFDSPKLLTGVAFTSACGRERFATSQRGRQIGKHMRKKDTDGL